MTGNDLYSLMNSDRTAAVRYIQGLADMQGYIYTSEQNVAVLSKKPINHHLYICIPDGATYGQINDVLNKYLAEHAESRHLSATNIFYMALFPVWRCEAPT